jgi:ABC-type sulfate/molybdate transport systems ATPase subunit
MAAFPHQSRTAVNLSVDRETRRTVLAAGPSGAGKTMALDAIGGLR